MSLPKYMKIVSRLLPVGAVGASVLLASAAPSAAREEAATAATPKERVSERLAAIRDAVSATDPLNAQSSERQPMLAWWNGGYYYQPWGNWPNWRNWRNWGNFWRNW